MSDYKEYYVNMLNQTLKGIQSLVKSGFQELYSLNDDLNDVLKESDILKKRIKEFERIKEKNEDLKKRIKELEELLKIAKERD